MYVVCVKLKESPCNLFALLAAVGYSMFQISGSVSILRFAQGLGNWLEAEWNKQEDDLLANVLELFTTRIASSPAPAQPFAALQRNSQKYADFLQFDSSK